MDFSDFPTVIQFKNITILGIGKAPDAINRGPIKVSYKLQSIPSAPQSQSSADYDLVLGAKCRVDG